jgi:hypothetical protein
MDYQIACKGLSIRGSREFWQPHAKPFPQKSTMNVGEIQLSRQVSCHSSPHCRYQELKDADGEFWRLKTVRVLSLVVKTLFSSCLDRIELFLLNTDPCF